MRRRFRTLATMLGAAALGACGQPQAASTPANDETANLRNEVTQLRQQVETLEQQQADLRKDVQACTAQHSDDEPAVEEGEPQDGGGSKSKRSSSRSSSSKSGGPGGSSGSSGPGKEVRMPGSG